VLAFVPAINDAPTGWGAVALAGLFIVIIAVGFWRFRKSGD
jgi:hypothetical protein